VSDTRLRQSLRRLARRQYHVISRSQARQQGANRKKIDALVASGEWDWVTSSVLRLVGGRGSFEQRCMIAVIHTGGVLCGETTLALCKVAGFSRRERIRVAIRRGDRVHALAGVVISQVRSLPEHHTMSIDGIASVTPTRAIYDLAARFHWERVRRALKSTWRKRFTSGGLLHRMGPEWLGRGRPGTVAMRELLAVTENDYRMPDTNLEDRLCTILEEAGFPRPTRQVNLGNDSRWIGRVDIKDPQLPLIGEADSETFHFAPIDGDDEAARDKAFGEAGFHVVRFTEHEIWHERAVVVQRWREARAKCQTDRAH
jgi:very-short-patch-repair endonuclease